MVVSKISKDIDHALDELQSEISENKRQISFLQSFDWTKPVTEEEWHKICDTPLRSSREVLPVLVKNLFPSASNIEVGCNFVFFELYGYKIQIPTSCMRGINISTEWYRYTSRLEDCYYHSGSMVRLKKFFDAKDQKMGWKAEAAARYNRDHANTIHLFLWWFGCHKWQKVDRKLFETKWKEEENRATERKKKTEQEKEDNKNHLLFIRDTLLPELNKFSAEHGPYVRQGTGSQKSIDELFEMERMI